MSCFHGSIGSSELVDKVRQTIQESQMLPIPAKVVVAVSGGADSVALLHALWVLRNELYLSLIVAHLNHGLRGEEADKDAVFVEDLAARLNLPAVVEKVNVRKIRMDMRIGLEETAREVRYSFLERVAEDTGADRIAVAHTADDQAETILHNIIRGTGPNGLSGMPIVRNKIIRPMINVFRSEVEAYLKEIHLDWRTDETNFSLDFTRNRIRRQLIPLIEEQFNSRIKESLLNLSCLVKDEAAVVADAAAEAFKASVKEVGKDKVVFDADKLRKLPRALLRRCLRQAIEQVKGDLRDIEYSQIEWILEHLFKFDGFTLTLPTGQIYGQLKAGELIIFRRVPPRKVDIQYKLVVPGETKIPELGVVLETKLGPKLTPPQTPYQATLDPNKIVGQLIVRTWRPGDRMVPFGMKGHKKLQDIFTDMKIPRSERGLIPVVADEDKIVWVAGIATSEQTKITPETPLVLWIEVKPL